MNTLLAQADFGSRLYGTATPTSDFDTRQVRFLPVEALLGLGDRTPNFRQKIAGDTDVAGWYLPDFARLVLKGAPEVTEFLFAAHTDCGRDWAEVRQVLQQQVSQKVYRTFWGACQTKLMSASKLGSSAAGNKELAAALRYLYEAAELLRTGRLQFPLAQAAQLRAVRAGELDGPEFVRVLDLAKDDFELAFKTTTLPAEGSFESAEAVVMFATRRWLE